MSVSVQAGDDAQAACYRYPTRAPILSLTARDMHVTVTSNGTSDQVTCADVAFASALAREAAAFAAETGRLHAAQYSTPDQCSCAAAQPHPLPAVPHAA